MAPPGLRERASTKVPQNAVGLRCSASTSSQECICKPLRVWGSPRETAPLEGQGSGSAALLVVEWIGVVLAPHRARGEGREGREDARCFFALVVVQVPIREWTSCEYAIGQIRRPAGRILFFTTHLPSSPDWFPVPERKHPRHVPSTSSPSRLWKHHDAEERRPQLPSPSQF